MSELFRSVSPPRRPRLNCYCGRSAIVTCPLGHCPMGAVAAQKRTDAPYRSGSRRRGSSRRTGRARQRGASARSIGVSLGGPRPAAFTNGKQHDNDRSHAQNDGHDPGCLDNGIPSSVKLHAAILRHSSGRRLIWISSPRCAHDPRAHHLNTVETIQQFLAFKGDTVSVASVVCPARHPPQQRLAY